MVYLVPAAPETLAEIADASVKPLRKTVPSPLPDGAWVGPGLEPDNPVEL